MKKRIKINLLIFYYRIPQNVTVSLTSRQGYNTESHNNLFQFRHTACVPGYSRVDDVIFYRPFPVCYHFIVTYRFLSVRQCKKSSKRINYYPCLKINSTGNYVILLNVSISILTY
ncbi:hypothetical protein AKG16_03015 [Morganella morganii]|nr:hypothetical protein AKG16_03015 [Morganella morganii]